jgi:RNA recognition motif-containing protein
VTDINLVRHPETGESRGNCFLAYEDQRSTVLAVDNFNGASINDRLLHVNHVKDYGVPVPRVDDASSDNVREAGVHSDSEAPQVPKAHWRYVVWQQAKERKVRKALKKQSKLMQD